jgi:hypothetical protein
LKAAFGQPVIVTEKIRLAPFPPMFGAPLWWLWGEIRVTPLFAFWPAVLPILSSALI